MDTKQDSLRLHFASQEAWEAWLDTQHAFQRLW